MFNFLKSHIVTTFAVYGGAVIVLCTALWVAYQFVDPAPPKRVVIAAGGKNGAYYQYAQQYAKVFASEGIELVIRESKGSMDNLARMAEPESDVDAAFMQGGTTTPEEHPDLRSLGSLYYEPLWFFYRKNLPIDNLTDVKGMKVAIGPDGSGTNFVIKHLLSENKIATENTTLVEKGSDVTVPQLLAGDIDAVFLIAGVNSPIIKELSHPGNNVQLLSFSRAETYARSHHYLTRLILPEGAINLAEDLPTGDVSMLAPTANLVIREEMHPAIKYLFLIAAQKGHANGDIFAMPGAFPNDKALLFPLASEAESFYKKGPPFLMRYLPYRLAITMERLKILLIPLLTLLYPLFKITPPAYRWQIRRRIFKWYKQLKELDLEAYDITTLHDAEAMLTKLRQLDRHVLETSVPISYSDYVYSLRIHIRMIQDRLEKLDFADDSTT